MAMTRYDPNALFPDEFSRNLVSRFSRLLGDIEGNGLTSAWAPAVDIKEDPDKFFVNVDVPGVDPKDIEVTLENGVLTISGSREEEKKEEKEGYSRVERMSGKFFRRFMLPESVDEGKVSARTDKGVLHITIPKSDKQKARRISVS
jgi:HSP20 family protein